MFAHITMISMHHTLFGKESHAISETDMSLSNDTFNGHTNAKLPGICHT